MLKISSSQKFRIHNGEVAVPTGPGLGVQLNEEVFRKYRCRAALSSVHKGAVVSSMNIFPLNKGGEHGAHGRSLRSRQKCISRKGFPGPFHNALKARRPWRRSALPSPLWKREYSWLRQENDATE